MSGLFNGLEIGKRALLSSQLAMTTIGHNMANVDTPGFSRQRVSVTSSEPIETPWGNAGSGVKITGIEHIRDNFLTGQFRSESGSQGHWEYMSKTVSQIEGFFNEPQENSLGNALDKFWQSWEALANNPDNSASRASLIEEANSLTNTFHQLNGQITKLRQNVDQDIKSKVYELNQLGSQIANLNLQISYQELGSENANDLRDQRDLLIDKLSKMVDVTVLNRENGQSAVLIGAMAFVDGSEMLEIGTDIQADEGDTKTKIVWANTDVEIKFSNGAFNAMLEARDKTIPKIQDQLDTLARGIVENVNGVHNTGYGLDGETGRDFFDAQFTDASHISLDISILQNPDNIAASTSGAPGDGSNALGVAKVLNQDRVMDNGSSTISEYYGSMIGKLGVESQQAGTYEDNYGLLVQQIENRRQSVQGVSLDEEMTNLVRFQNAYKAAARIITAMDEALQTVISGMGVVGR